MIRNFMLSALVFTLFSCNTQSQSEETKGTPAEQVVEDYTEFYDNGQIKIEGKTVNGKRHGMWKSYYENGLKWSETSFNMGLKSGLTTTYLEDGMMRYKGQYYNDERTGEWLFYDSLGYIMKKIDFTPRSDSDSLKIDTEGLFE
jgi:antitoxin component YwqK of YwqJK toxin-antitoxin module